MPPVPELPPLAPAPPPTPPEPLLVPVVPLVSPLFMPPALVEPGCAPPPVPVGRDDAPPVSPSPAPAEASSELPPQPIANKRQHETQPDRPMAASIAVGKGSLCRADSSYLPNEGSCCLVVRFYLRLRAVFAQCGSLPSRYSSGVAPTAR